MIVPGVASVIEADAWINATLSAGCAAWALQNNAALGALARNLKGKDGPKAAPCKQTDGRCLRPPRLSYRSPFSLVQRAELGVLRAVLLAEVVWRRPLLPFRLVDFCVRPVDFCDVWRTPLIRSSGNSEARVLA